MPLRLLLAFVLLALAGCRSEAPPPEPAPPAPSVTLPETAAPAPTQAPLAEVRQHDLRVEDVRRYGRAAEAVLQAAAEDPEVQRLHDDLEMQLTQAASLEEVQQILDANPRIQRALSEAGVSTRDYVLTGTALLGAYSYLLMREEGVDDAFRPEYVTDEHVRFIEHNRAEVDAVVARLQELYGTDFDDFAGPE